MRIGIIGSRGIDSNYSGIERGLQQLCPRLVARGHEIIVFSETRDGRGPDEEEHKGVKIVRVPALRSKHLETLSRSGLSFVRSLGKGIDVVNFRAEGPGMFSILAKLLRMRCVVTIHGLDWKRDKWSGAAAWSLKLAERTAAKHADRIIVVSGALQRYFREKYGRESIYIPNGIAPKSAGIGHQRLKALGLKSKGYVLFASRLVPEKGCHELIEAYHGIETDKRLVIAGTARYESPYLKRLREMANPEKVVFTGHVEGELLEELYQNAYLFVLPSHIEGLSNALLEALGHRISVLVSDIPENLEAIGDYGFAFKVGNVLDLKDKLERLLTNSDLVETSSARMGVLLEKGYSWDTVADRYEEVFRSLVC